MSNNVKEFIINKVLDFKDNVLDEQMESVRTRLNKLEKISHKPNKCKCKQKK